MSASVLASPLSFIEKLSVDVLKKHLVPFIPIGNGLESLFITSTEMNKTGKMVTNLPIKNTIKVEFHMVKKSFPKIKSIVGNPTIHCRNTKDEEFFICNFIKYNPSPLKLSIRDSNYLNSSQYHFVDETWKCSNIVNIRSNNIFVKFDDSISAGTIDMEMERLERLNSKMRYILSGSHLLFNPEDAPLLNAKFETDEKKPQLNNVWFNTTIFNEILTPEFLNCFKGIPSTIDNVTIRSHTNTMSCFEAKLMDSFDGRYHFKIQEVYQLEEFETEEVSNSWITIDTAPIDTLVIKNSANGFDKEIDINSTVKKIILKDEPNVIYQVDEDDITDTTYSDEVDLKSTMCSIILFNNLDQPLEIELDVDDRYNYVYAIISDVPVVVNGVEVFLENNHDLPITFGTYAEYHDKNGKWYNFIQWCEMKMGRANPPPPSFNELLENFPEDLPLLFEEVGEDF